MMKHRARAQPSEQLIAIRRAQDFIQRVFALARLADERDREQMQVVIAEHDDRGVAQLLDSTQYAERFGATVDEVADEPDAVCFRVEVNLFEKPIELGAATLNVADGVGCHTSNRGGAS